jgi:hypothetical protein
MNKRRRYLAKRRRQIHDWIREYNQLHKLWYEYDEPYVCRNKTRRWYLMRKLGL